MAKLAVEAANDGRNCRVAWAGIGMGLECMQLSYEIGCMPMQCL